MGDIDKQDSQRALEIARKLRGPMPHKQGWKLKIFEAAFEGALSGLGWARQFRLDDLKANDDDLALARAAAIEVLMARLPRAEFSQREKLRSRIAAIKSGTSDTVPEVQSALLVLDRVRRPT